MAGTVLVDLALVVLGSVFVWFRVPIAISFREARERQGSRDAASQTPGLVGVVGAFFLLGGLVVVIGTLAGWIHPR